MKTFFLTSIYTLALLVATSCGSNSNVTIGDSKALNQPSVKNISQSEVKSLTTSGALLIDVRTPEEVNEGFIVGTEKFIDFQNESFQTEISKLDPEKSYIIYCRSGGRSARAADMMVKNGFKNIYNLEGGILGWSGKIEKR